MILLDVTTTALSVSEPDDPLAGAHLAAAAAFLARYQGRTLDAYRHDLRVFFLGLPDDIATRSPLTPAPGASFRSKSTTTSTLDWQPRGLTET